MKAWAKAVLGLLAVLGGVAGIRRLKKLSARRYLLYLPFNEGQGDVAHDASGHGHDAALTNVLWPPTGQALIPAEGERGIYFSGSGSSAMIADAPDLNPDIDFYIELDICPTPVAGLPWYDTQGDVAMKGQLPQAYPPSGEQVAQSRGWRMFYRTGGIMFYPCHYFATHYTDPWGCMNTIHPGDNKWSRIKFELLPSINEIRGYVNDALEATTKYPDGLTNLAAAGRHVYLGASQYRGYMDEFKMRLL